MPDPSLLARQLERYRKLLFGATDPLLIEGLRKLIAELEVKLDPLLPQEPVAETRDSDSDLLEPVS